jgi:hypothetical protein
MDALLDLLNHSDRYELNVDMAVKAAGRVERTAGRNLDRLTYAALLIASAEMDLRRRQKRFVSYYPIQVAEQVLNELVSRKQSLIDEHLIEEFWHWRIWVLAEGQNRSEDAVSLLISEPELLRSYPKIAKQLADVTGRSVVHKPSTRVNRSIKALQDAKGFGTSGWYDELIALLEKLRQLLEEPIPSSGISVK